MEYTRATMKGERAERSKKEGLTQTHKVLLLFPVLRMVMAVEEVPVAVALKWYIGAVAQLVVAVVVESVSVLVWMVAVAVSALGATIAPAEECVRHVWKELQLSLLRTMKLPGAVLHWSAVE